MSAVELMRDGTLSIPDAVEFSGLGRSKIYELMEGGRLPYVKEGARRLIPKLALQELLAQRLVGGPEQSEPVPSKSAREAGRR
jgi:excisionase family DNA binding protein